MLMFIQRPYDTKILLRYSNNIAPGQLVYVPNPEVKSFLEDDVVVTMNNPLVPVKEGCNAQVVNPPSNIEKAQYIGLDFVTNGSDLSSVVPVDGVCSGKFCHAQKERILCMHCGRQ